MSLRAPQCRSRRREFRPGNFWDAGLCPRSGTLLNVQERAALGFCHTGETGLLSGLFIANETPPI